MKQTTTTLIRDAENAKQLHERVTLEVLDCWIAETEDTIATLLLSTYDRSEEIADLTAELEDLRLTRKDMVYLVAEDEADGWKYETPYGYPWQTV